MKPSVGPSTYPVNLQQHDFTWKSEYGRVARQISAALHAIPHHIAHVGSTAVPHLIAQPTIDILVGLNNSQHTDLATAILSTQLHFRYLESASSNTLVYLVLEKQSLPTHYLHLVTYESPDWQRIIQFKQLLNSQPEIRDQYAMTKLKLARQYADDIQTYHQQKHTFIDELLSQKSS